MKDYKISLTRTYFITIQAENKEQAKIFSEYYLGDCPDLSTEKEQIDRKFCIKNIEMVYNEALEIIDTMD